MTIFSLVWNFSVCLRVELCSCVYMFIKGMWLPVLPSNFEVILKGVPSSAFLILRYCPFSLFVDKDFECNY